MEIVRGVGILTGSLLLFHSCYFIHVISFMVIFIDKDSGINYNKIIRIF